MKGIVFTEFMEMVDTEFGIQTTENIIAKSNLANGGAYTSVGTYPHSELVTLVVNLGKEKEIPVTNLLEHFGGYLFERFTIHYSNFFEDIDDAFIFLEGIENVIHTEVRKLYPDAELPNIIPNRISEDLLELVYHSEKSMAHFALGLIKGSLKHFSTDASIEMSPVVHGVFSDVVFTITKN